MKTKIANIILILLVLSSCSPSDLAYKDYLLYLNNPDNGLIKERQANDIVLKLKYLPIDYLVHQDLKKDGIVETEIRDSLEEVYGNSLTFLLNISPKSGKQGRNDNSVMFKGIDGIESYKNRAIQMNFSMSEFLSLRNKNGEIAPVLCNMENTYDVSTSRSIYVVFSKEMVDRELKKEDWEFVYEDQLFETGIHVFSFDKDDIAQAPVIEYN